MTRALAVFALWALLLLAFVLTSGPLSIVFYVAMVSVAALGGHMLARWNTRRTRRRFERLHPPGVELVPLTDSPMDGTVEEHGWVPLGLAKTPEQAIEVLAGAYPELESYRSLVVTGKSFHRPDEHIKGEHEGYFILDPDGPEVHLGPYRGQLSEYRGQWSEWITWQKCERDDDRAVECWDLEVAEDGLDMEDD